MTRNLIEIRLCITCAVCNQYRVRPVHVSPQPLDADEHLRDIYYVNVDAYRVCLECERSHPNDAASVRANIESRRQQQHSLDRATLGALDRMP